MMNLVFVGSSKFVKEMAEIEKQLSERDIVCLLPEPLVSEEDYAKENTREKLLQMKPFFTKRHCKKIENSDAVLVINNEKKGIKGYLGSNTLMEIAIALHFDKKIFFLNNFGEDHPHFEELVGLKAIILDGDLSKIKIVSEENLEEVA